MAAPVTIRNLRDSYVDQNRPTKNYINTARLKLSAESGKQKQAFVFFGKPWAAGSTILPSYLRVWNAEALAGSVTVTVERLTEAWSGNRINWNNRPAVGGTAITLTKSNAAKDTMWEIPITSILQFVSNGGAWYGLKITVNGTAVKSFYSTQAGSVDVRPQVYVQWSDAPEPPENLSPAGGRFANKPKPLLSYQFTDASGDTTLAAHHIQFSATSDFTTPTWETPGGFITTTVPEFDTSTSTWGGLAAGALTWWRVRVRDGAGVDSGWSDPVQFGYQPKGTLTTSSLGVDGSGNFFVEDTSPPIIWALAGRTQTKYRVTIADLADPDVLLFNSGQVSGTNNSIDTSAKVIKNTTSTYRLTIQVWDDIAREKNGDDPVPTVLQRDFKYVPGNTVTPPSNLVAAPEYPWPWVNLTFDRSTPPDSFTILRDGEVVENNIDPGSIFVSGTSYKYSDKTAPPRYNHTWQVVANVNAKDSQPSNSVTTQSRPSVTWMMDTDAGNPICLVKSASEPTPVVDAQAMTMQEIHQPVGGGSPVLITQYLSGFEGHVDAVLADDIAPGLTARQMKSRFKTWKKNAGTVVLLFMVDEVLRVVPYNMTYRPRAKSGGQILYDVSFDFFEVD